MYTPIQSRPLAVSSDVWPVWGGQEVLLPQRLTGTEALGKLYEYRIDVATLDCPTCRLAEAQGAIDAEAMIGKPLTISIEFEGKGTFVPGLPGDQGAGNLGAGVRTITGLITEMRSTGCDDRRAYYQIVVRPWLWLARLNSDSRSFQNMSVVEVTEAVLKGESYGFPYRMRLGAPNFRTGVYPKRDYIRQMWESDYAFLTRIWREWGIYYVFDGLTLVLCDFPGSHQRHHNMYDTIGYHAPDGNRIDEEHIHRLKLARRITAGDVTLNDYDYTQSRGRFVVNRSRFSESARDNTAQYHWGDYSQPLAGAMGLTGTPNDHHGEGEHLASTRVRALRSKQLRVHGRGNLRGLTTGRLFRLEGHPQQEANVEYFVVSTSIDLRNPDETSRTTESDPHYRCVTDFVAQPGSTLFGNRLRRKPRAQPETAVVVGPADQPVWLDGYARVKVQFAWDRLGDKDENSSIWVRVALPWHGGPHSFIAVPRVGDEVTIAYHEGDPDKPYIAASKVNQFNQPPFELPKNQALTGLVSNGLDGRGNNFVVTDDTPGQLQVQVASDQANSRLVLGYNTRIDYRTGRLQARGLGWELATNAWGVLRANQGMLISTAPRDGASTPAKDIGETAERLRVARDQQDTFASVARQQLAQEAGDQDEVAEALQIQHDQILGSAAAHQQDGSFPEFDAPHLVLNGEAGLAGVTPASLHLVSGEHTALTAGGHVGLSVGKRLLVSVARGVRTLVQSCGWKLVAMSGDIELNALKDNLKLLAKLAITASANEITITAKEKLVISGGGSATQYTSGGITHMTNGGYVAHAGGFTFTGPKSLAAPFPDSPKPGQGTLELFHTYATQHGAMSDYRVEDALGKVVTGVLSEKGFASVSGLAPGPARVTFGTDKADPWAPSSYVHNVEWPEKKADAAGAAPAQAADIASQALSAAGQAVQAAKTVSQLAGAMKGGTLLADAAQLSGVAQTLLAATGAIPKPASAPSPALSMRTPDFV